MFFRERTSLVDALSGLVRSAWYGAAACGDETIGFGNQGLSRLGSHVEAMHRSKSE